MTPEEWEAGNDPRRLLESLRGRASGRKLRLFSAACWRVRAPRLKTGGRNVLGVVAEVEALADRQIAGLSPRSRNHVLTWGNVLNAARRTVRDFSQRPQEGVREAVMVGLLRDVFGNPFRPVSLSPSLPTPVVVSLAQAAYQDRDLPSGHLDQNRLAVLADALEEAGCTDADILGHLRGPGPHVRGCWPVDLILSKDR